MMMRHRSRLVHCHQWPTIVKAVDQLGHPCNGGRQSTSFNCGVYWLAPAGVELGKIEFLGQALWALVPPH
eukprot:616895-Amphidinium_carterae.1